jgi:hypothetical protein
MSANLSRDQLQLRANQLARALHNLENEGPATIPTLCNRSDSEQQMKDPSSSASSILMPKSTNSSTNCELMPDTAPLDHEDVCQVYFSDVEVVSPPKRKVSGEGDEGSDKKSRMS